MRNRFGNEWAGSRVFASCLLAALLSAPLGCGVDDPFSAQTDDEYTEPLINALIGTPTTVTTISSKGESEVADVALPSAGSIVGAAGSTASGGASSGSGGNASGDAAGKGGSPGVPGSGGGFPEAGAVDPGSDGGFGMWHFDDCSPTSHFMLDSSGLGAHAQQALNATCVPGISGQGVNFRSEKDVVQVQAQPRFTLDQHVAVAAWVNPKTVSGDQPIVVKRLNNKTAFSLGVHKGNIEMSVVLSTGKTVISRAPIAAKKWTHVAGMYDGTFVFLFINGQQFGQVFAAGGIRDVVAPIRIGATTQSQFFNGAIDEVFVTTQTIRSDVLTSLACIGRPSTLSVDPPTSGPVPADATVHYDVSVTNNDVGACRATLYDVFFNGVEPGFIVNVESNFLSAAPGAAVKFGVSVTGTDNLDAGVHALPFTVDGFGGPPNFDFEQLRGQLSYELAAPTGCFVRPRRELMITDLSVVDDPIRTAGSSNPSAGFSGPGGGPGTGGEVGGFDEAAGETGNPGAGGSFGSAGAPNKGGSFAAGGSAPITPQTAGVWSFGYLMREMAATPADAPGMTLKLLQHWLTDQTVNGFTVAARPAMQRQLIDIWPKTADGELDLDQSPLTLQAIVNRIDLRNLAEGSAGEGRFVYGVNGNNFQNFTVIVEYKLVAHTEEDVSDWANRWHALGALPFPSQEYNAALEAVTRRFTDHGASPGSPNGSALVELRTNEIALSFRWELRSFVLSPTTGLFAQTTVKGTPDLSFNNTAVFANFVNQNAATIIAEVPGGDSHTVPLQSGGQNFMGGSVFNNQVPWMGPGIEDPEARFHASLNTCNGCHGPDSGTFAFLMVRPRPPGSEAQLSPFITGTRVSDPFSGQIRTLNDLGRRTMDLTGLVCASTPTPAVAVE